MKAIRLHVHGGPEAFVFEDAAIPAPQNGEVLIRVHAAGVTPTELQWEPTWAQESGAPRPFPIVLGHEFSGVVERLGPEVREVAVGDEVYGMNDWYRDGTHAEYCLARAVDISPKPRTSDHAHTSITPISALTAWQGLFERAHLTKGERVLIHGGAGGVGSFAVQLARRCGADVIATASAHNLDFVKELGADEVLNYHVERFEQKAPFDVVFDSVGGETLARSWNALGANGRMVTIAASEEGTQGERTQAAFFIVEPKQTQLKEIANLIDKGELRVVLGGEFPLRDAAKAYLEKPRHGKIALVMS